MPSKDITFCTPDGNECPKKFKCWRFTAEHDPQEMIWYSDNWNLYGHKCPYFTKLKLISPQ